MVAGFADIEASRETKVLCWVLLRILFTFHNTFDSLKASMVAGFADIEAFRESKVLCWVQFRILSLT